jgi:hypothetical protein
LVRRLGNPWAWLIVSAAVIACAVAGCGGGGSDTGSTSTGVQLHTPTAPNFPGADRFHPDGGVTSTTQTQSGGLHRGQANVQRVLAPFQACLQDHGVPPFHFDPQHQQQQQPDPAQTQKRIQAQIACIPKLPPRLRQAAERLKRRYEQHQR